MTNMNVVVLQGNLVADPEIVGKDSNVARFTLAVNNGFGENQEASFVDCVAFGKQVEAIGEFLKKGKQVVIKGSIHQNRWETKEGEKRSKLEVRLDNFAGFSFVSGGKSDAAKGEPVAAAVATDASEEKPKLF